MAGMAFQQTAPTVASPALAASSANTALSERQSGGVLRVVNPNTVVCFVRVGVGAQVATAADIPVGAGATSDIQCTGDNVAVIGQAAGTLPVYFCQGSQG